MTMHAALPLDASMSWLFPAPPAPELRIAAWRNERHVFAAAELGWLCDEARRRLHRTAGRAEGFDVLRDVHLDRDAFGLLAAHPRLLARAADLLGDDVEIDHALVQCGTLVEPLYTQGADRVVAIVPLGWRAEAPLGGISIGRRPPSGARYDWPLVVVYRPLRDAPPPHLADDCLWPSASAVAG